MRHMILLLSIAWMFSGCDIEEQKARLASLGIIPSSGVVAPGNTVPPGRVIPPVSTLPPKEVIPPEETTPPVEEVKKDPLEEKRTVEWYVRLRAEAVDRRLVTYSAQLGVLEDAALAEEYSLSHYAPFAPYIDIRFEDPEGLENGNYKSYFKPYQEGESAVWRFTVRSDDSAADVNLTWRGLYVLTAYENDEGERRFRETVSYTDPILKYMQIVDESTGKATPVIKDGKIQTISFNMNGANSRSFRWELLQDVVEIEETEGRVTPRSAHISSSRSLVQSKSTIRVLPQCETVKSGAVFDMMKPPVFGTEK